MILPVAAGWMAGGLLLRHPAILELQMIPFGLSVLTVDWLPNLRRAISRVQLLMLLSGIAIPAAVYPICLSLLRIPLRWETILALALFSLGAVALDGTISRARLSDRRGFFSSMLRGRFHLGRGLVFDRWRKPFQAFIFSMLVFLIVAGAVLLSSDK